MFASRSARRSGHVRRALAAAAVLVASNAHALPEPLWDGQGAQSSETYGFATAAAGDVNGDGYGDFIVASPWYDHSGANRGRVWVYHGGASGLTTAAWQYDGASAGDHYGYSVAGVGDVNGDGYDDVLIGTGLATVSGIEGRGIANLFLGGPTGLAPAPAWWANGDQEDDLYGGHVAAIGDVNGDGYADFAVGAAGADVDGALSAGHLYLYHGGPSISLDRIISGEHSPALVGSFATGLDFNGDGYSDLVYLMFDTALDARYYLRLGGPGGIPASDTTYFVSGDLTGTAAAALGDVNGDGYADFLLGDPTTPNGSMALVYGNDDPLHLTGWALPGDFAGERFGNVVAFAGDPNGDGYADFLVQSGGTGDVSTAHLFYGSPEGPTVDPVWTSTGSTAWHGWRLGTAGDVDGDGHSEIFVSSPYRDNPGGGEGRVDVFAGGTEAPGVRAIFTDQGDALNDHFGTAVAIGDWNGDGIDDVAVGSGSIDVPGADAGHVFVYYGPTEVDDTPDWEVSGESSGMRLGDAVATALDVNGDGYEDLLVGSPAYDGGRGEARVYLGGEDGLGALPAWTADGDAGTDAFGYAVKSAGDVNADGYADVIVGAPGGDGSPRRGKAYVYLGSPTGLAGTPVWEMEGDQPGAEFGFSVTGAGDVTGDGFDDILVGAPGYDGPDTEEGRTFLYIGGFSGILDWPPWITEIDVAGARHGHSVASAGDVNGDGYGDVVVGSPYRGPGGQVDVYHGGPNPPGYGLEQTWAFSHPGALLGWSVGGADLDRDGLTDIVIGAPGVDNGQVDEGQVWGFRAPFTDLSPWFANDGNLDYAGHGSSLAVGDPNGDGVADILAGLPGRAGVASSLGAAHVWPGNALWDGGTTGAILTGGATHGFHTRTDGGSRPLALLGGTSTDDILVEGFLRSPLGRDELRLEVEVKPTGVPFDGTGTVIGDAIDTGDPGDDGSRALASIVAAGLADDAFRWRARILGDRPTWKGSPWFTPTRNAVTQTDFRTGLTVLDVAVTSPGPGATPLVASPSPFRRSTGFRFRIDIPGDVSLRIYDAQGREVAQAFDGPMGSGDHELRWTPSSSLAGGVYFARLETPEGPAEARLVWVR
jgi:hypothetical protein